MRFINPLILLAMIVTLFVLSGASSINLAQQDLTKLSLAELKQTAGLLTEVEYRRDESLVFKEKSTVYESMIKEFQSNEQRYEQQIKNLNLTIEAVKPSWYDHFWIGAALTGVIVSSIYFLAK